MEKSPKPVLGNQHALVPLCTLVHAVWGINMMSYRQQVYDLARIMET